MHQPLPKTLSYGIVPVRFSEAGPEFLVVQHWEGHWSLPKGMPEPGESELETAMREFAEECGISEVRVVEEAQFELSYHPVYNDVMYEKTVKFFLGIVPANAQVVVQESEIIGSQWLSLEEARKQGIKGMRVLEAASNYLETHPDLITETR